MKLIRKFLSFFSPVEVISLLSALTISTFLIIPAFTKRDYNEVNQNKDYIFADELVYHTYGGNPVDLFDTYFYLVYEESSDGFKAELIKTMNELIVPHHILFDRHHDYFALSPANPRFPTEEDRNTLPLVHNLKYVNDHKGERIKIEKPLYELLYAGKKYTLNTPQNAFNMFIGELYDYWSPFFKKDNSAKDPLVNEIERQKVERLQSFIPLSTEDINATLILEEVANEYFVTFNAFNGSGDDLSISVGAIAKGMMTDILARELKTRGYTKGYIFGGGSSITFLGRGFYGSDYPINLANINPESTKGYALRFARSDQYQMSTSGIYEGQRFMFEGQEIIRSHIIEPRSGYPVQNTHQAVNITSATLSCLDLDYLTTTLTILPVDVGVSFVQEKYKDHEVNIAYLGKDESGWFIQKTDGYPGRFTTLFEQNSEYREKFLDLL